MSDIEHPILAREDQEQAAIERIAYGFDIDRRDFFKLVGGGVLVCLCVKAGTAQESGRRPNFSEEEVPKAIAAWLHIDGNGTVTVYTGKAEMGQNIRTSLSQQVAEELQVPIQSVKLIMGDTDLTPYDRGTFGSRTTPYMGPQLRRVASSAKDVLVAMAAKRWGTQASALTAHDGKVTNPKTKQSISYGELTQGQRITQVIEAEDPLVPVSEWKIAGTPVPKVDGRDFVTGRHRYAADMARPGMMFGKVLRPAAFDGVLVSLDSAAAEKIPGAKVVHDGNFVGVAASSPTAADKAVTGLSARWNAPPQISDRELFEYLRKNAEKGEDDDQHVSGSVAEGMASASKTVAGVYTVAYIAHAPLEPRAAMAEWAGDKLTVWTGSQRPFAVRDELAQAFRIPKERVRVIIPDTGSAYGGKHTGEVAIEAARLAKAAGKPVKVVWTREEEFTWAYFRPAGVIDVKGGIRPDGTIVAWEFDNYNSGPAAIGTPYNIPHQRIQFHPVKSPLRQGSYRGLAATANFFARESHMDDLAHAAGMDPLQFRLKNLTDVRLRTVFQTAAEKFGWGKQKSSPDRGFGIAGGFEKGDYVATCAEVELDRKTATARIRRVVEAFDCGPVVNPSGLRNQIEGAIVQGIGGAMFEAVRFENGRISNPHFADYRVPRFRDLPQIEVALVDRKDVPPSGAGETPIMGLAPAVGNAIFAATGIRVRSLPMGPKLAEALKA